MTPKETMENPECEDLCNQKTDLVALVQKLTELQRTTEEILGQVVAAIEELGCVCE